MSSLVLRRTAEFEMVLRLGCAVVSAIGSIFWRVSQLTVYATILCLLMTFFSAGASTRKDIYLQSACNFKFLRAKNGSVFADDNLDYGVPQEFTLVATRTRDNRAAITIYSKETNSYICFDKNWRTKTMRAKANLSKRCMFFETFDASGAYRYRSVVNQNRSLGFQKNGKPIGGVRAGAKAGAGGRKRPIDEKCYSFNYINPTDMLYLDVPQQQAPPQQQQQPQKPEAKVPRPSSPPQRQRHRQQDTRKDAPNGDAGNAGGNSLLTATYSAAAGPDQRQSPPHRHRHKHGTVGRTGKYHQQQQQQQQVGYPNLVTGVTGAPSPAVPSPTLSSLYGGNLGDGGPVRGYGKGTHRRSHLNSYTPGEQPVSSSSFSSSSLPPKPGSAGSLLVDVVGNGGGPFRKDRQPAVAEQSNGRVSSGHGGAAAGTGPGSSSRKKAANGNGPGGRNGSTGKGATLRGRDKRASG